jgi:hypothetical protein
MQELDPDRVGTIDRPTVKHDNKHDLISLSGAALIISI